MFGTLKNIAICIAFGFLAFVSCQKPEVMDSGISNVKLSNGGKMVYASGQTITVSFDATAAWTASLDIKSGEGDWAVLNSTTLSGDGGKDRLVRVAIDANKTPDVRVVEVWVAVDGFAAECICTLEQLEDGASAASEINRELNTYMHEILKKDYLFADAYNDQEIDLTVNYTDFLAAHLLELDKKDPEQIADGGYYRATSSNAGQRFIYTNIVEAVPLTKAIQTGGLGFGPFISTSLAPGSQYMGIAPSYVRRGSPAEAAGMRRGDLIIEVNGTVLTVDNYRNYLYSLYQNPSGQYAFKYLRYEPNSAGVYEHVTHSTGTMSPSLHIYDPVLYATVLSDPDKSSVKIGYLVYESFDLNSHEFLTDAVSQFKQAGITDLILDLRFNAGGAVAQSRWLSGCIAGAANGNRTFTNVVYNNGRTEKWTFDYGYDNDTDNLGKPVDLGLSRLFVICSYNTASAAELVISSLKGIDFPVKLIGCRTEGKNVGMTVSETTYKGRVFQFSPVTFWVRNEKDWGEYSDGIIPDEVVVNENNPTDKDPDNVFPYSFGDWGNMDYNIALQWAYCDITGKSRWGKGQLSASTSAVKSGAVKELVPGEHGQLVLENGRYGSLIYK